MIEYLVKYTNYNFLYKNIEKFFFSFNSIFSINVVFSNDIILLIDNGQFKAAEKQITAN